MLTLTALKLELGIKESNENLHPVLSQIISQVVSRIRHRTDRKIAWVSDQIIQRGADVAIRCIGHGLRSGQVVTIAGSNSTPTIDGDQTIGVIDQDTLSIAAITLTAAGTFATIHPQIIQEFRALARDRAWVPEQLTPFLELEELADLNGDNTWGVVDPADYKVPYDQRTSKGVLIERLDGWFTTITKFPRGQYGLREKSRTSGVRITIRAGMPEPPSELVMAGLSMCADLFERQGRGKDQASFSFEGVSRSSMAGAERKEHILSPDSIIESWRARTI